MIVASSPAIVTIVTPEGEVLHQNAHSKAYFGDYAADPAAAQTADALSRLFDLEPLKFARMLAELPGAQVWKAVLRVPPSLAAAQPAAAGFGAADRTPGGSQDELATAAFPGCGQGPPKYGAAADDCFDTAGATGTATRRHCGLLTAPSPSELRLETATAGLDDLLFTRTSRPHHQNHHLISSPDPAAAATAADSNAGGGASDDSNKLVGARDASLSSYNPDAASAGVLPLACRTPPTAAYDEILSANPRRAPLSAGTAVVSNRIGSPQCARHLLIQSNQNRRALGPSPVNTNGVKPPPLARGLSLPVVSTAPPRSPSRGIMAGGITAAAVAGDLSAGAGRNGTMVSTLSGAEMYDTAHAGSPCGSSYMAFDPLATSTFATLTTSPSIVLAGSQQHAAAASNNPAPVVPSGSKTNSGIGGDGGSTRSCKAASTVASASAAASAAAAPRAAARATEGRADGDGTGELGGGGGFSGGGSGGSFRRPPRKTASCLLLRHATDGPRCPSISARAASRTGGSRALAFALSLNTFPHTASPSEPPPPQQQQQQQQRRQQLPPPSRSPVPQELSDGAARSPVPQLQRDDGERQLQIPELMARLIERPGTFSDTGVLQERGSAPCRPLPLPLPQSSVYKHVQALEAANGAAAALPPRTLQPPGDSVQPCSTLFNPLGDGRAAGIAPDPGESGFGARTPGAQAIAAADGPGSKLLAAAMTEADVAVEGAVAAANGDGSDGGDAGCRGAGNRRTTRSALTAALASGCAALPASASNIAEGGRNCSTAADPAADAAQAVARTQLEVARAASVIAAAAAAVAAASHARGSDYGQAGAGPAVSGLWVPQECWHEVWATPARDPVTGAEVIVLSQMDVTAKVIAERHLALVMETEHRLVEQLFPRHVLQYITEEWTMAGAAGTGGADGAAGGADGGGGGGGGSLASWRPVVRDCNALATCHPEVTLLFADIKGFTPMCKEVEPQQVMALLNALYSRYDAMLDVYGVYKVETIGDCYFVAGGLIHEDEDGMAAVRGGRGREGGGGSGTGAGGEEDPLHAERVFSFAKAMLSAAREVMMPTSGQPVEIRIGLHTGPVVSGVVGTRMPRFCLFGDTVNTASRMESTGVPGAIHASEATFRRLAAINGEEWEPTGGIEVKGKGRMQTYSWRPSADGQSLEVAMASSAVAASACSARTSLRLPLPPVPVAATNAAEAAAAATTVRVNAGESGLLQFLEIDGGRAGVDVNADAGPGAGDAFGSDALGL